MDQQWIAAAVGALGALDLGGGLEGTSRPETVVRSSVISSDLQGLEEEMATHSSVLAWRILGTWEPGGL